MKENETYVFIHSLHILPPPFLNAQLECSFGFRILCYTFMLEQFAFSWHAYWNQF